MDYSHLERVRNSARDNDTLCGLLLEYELESEKHLRGEFGYWDMVEKRMVRERLAAEDGIDPNDPRLQFRVNAIVEKNHSCDISYRKISDRRINGVKAATKPEFTTEELQYLAEVFADANHPLARSICLKARERLLVDQ